MIVVIRHGNTELNTARVFQPYDTPLSKEGMEQVKLCGAWLAEQREMKLVKILTSDLLRTRQTTEAILSHAGRDAANQLPVVENVLLRERDFGDLKGRPYSDAPQALFDSLATEADLRDYEPPNGESHEAFTARVHEAWNWIVREAEQTLRGEDECLVVVTHGLVKKTMATKLWQGGEEHAKLVSFENTSLSILTARAPHEIKLFGSTQHLQQRL